MIATMLIGGLGNQMFQYATGRALALRNDTDLIIDQSGFTKDIGAVVARHYELDRLRIAARPANRVERLRLLLGRRPQQLLRWLGGWRIFRERSLAYDADAANSGDGTYLVGYWQSWRYFADIADRLASELQPAKPLSERSQSALVKMHGTDSVCLHVRRGDYLAAIHAPHGVIGIDWYRAALARIRETVARPTVYVFSDDLDWCRDAFADQDLELRFVDWNRGDDSWQDLYLMAGCKHAIIANSSFSWWAAWLGDQQAASGRRVIAPAQWRVELGCPISDICPPSWEPM